MKLFSGSSVVMRHCSACALRRMSSCAGTPTRFVADRRALGDADLRLDDVDAGDDLGHRVLDLDARIDLDEIELAGVGIHQELDRAGAAIVRRRCRSAARSRTAPARCASVEIRRRRALDHLLVAALDRAVALEQVHEIAVGVAEDLHLDVARPAHQLFEIDLVLAEAGLGLAPCHRQQLASAAHRSR